MEGRRGSKGREEYTIPLARSPLLFKPVSLWLCSHSVAPGNSLPSLPAAESAFQLTHFVTESHPPERGGGGGGGGERGRERGREREGERERERERERKR